MTVLDRFRLDGKVAVVTGASSGLGVACAQALAEAGADIALGARRIEPLGDTRALVEAAGRRALAVRTDVGVPDDCKALIEATVAEFGRVDVLINNAGVGTSVPSLRETVDDFRRVIDVNLNGTFWMAQAAAQAMENGGSIVNVSSITAVMSLGLPQTAYSASKAAVLGLTRDLAQQWTGRRGVRVNAVLPGLFETEMTSSYFEERMSTQIPLIPAGRGGRPEELAAAILFLASDASSYVTGQTLIVDGGRTLY